VPAFHGFVRELDGTITTIDVPGADDTQVFGINDRGQIAGVQRSRGGTFRGFVLDRGAFTTVDVPGAIGGDAGVNDIDDRGRLIGDYDDRISGYLRDERGRISTFDAPGAVGQTVPIGMDNRGRIVGTYSTADRSHGFLRDRHGRFMTIDVPEAKDTEAARINNRGQVVGAIRDSQFQIYGLLAEGGRLAALRLPGARSESYATDIDDRGRIIGIDR
jgi:uncharacterized membrane protein